MVQDLAEQLARSLVLFRYMIQLFLFLSEYIYSFSELTGQMKNDLG